MITTAWKVVTADRRPGWVGGPAGMYDKGKIVRAIEGSVGIFCFDSYDNALTWAEYWKPAIIIKVQGFGKPLPERLILDATAKFDMYKLVKQWKEGSNVLRSIIMISGTICFKTIKVLE